MAKNDTYKITSEIVEAHIQCERKAFLLLQGKIEGHKHKYSLILKERATANRFRFEASPEVTSRVFINPKNDMPYVVRSNGMIADCDFLFQSEPDNLFLKKLMNAMSLIRL